MIRVCLKLALWGKVYLALHKYAEANVCIPENPPRPLALSRWNYCNDLENVVGREVVDTKAD